MTDILFRELTRQIIGVYFDVYNGLSRTYPEFVYEKAMRRDLQQQGIACQQQEEYQIFYKGQLIGLKCDTGLEHGCRQSNRFCYSYPLHSTICVLTP